MGSVVQKLLQDSGFLGLIWNCHFAPYRSDWQSNTEKLRYQRTM